MSPTQRSLKQLRADGWHCEIVEHFNAFTKRRIDLFGWADILAVRGDDLPLLVQVTSTGVSARIKKIEQSETFPLVKGKFNVQVHGWRKNSKGRYVQRVITMA